MDFSILYDEETHLIVLEAIGDITVADAKEMVDAEIEMLEKHPGASILYCQKGENTVDFTSQEIWTISEYSAKLGELLVGKKLALVLPEDLNFGLGRMWKSITEVKVPFEINIFREVEEARKWVVK